MTIRWSSYYHFTITKAASEKPYLNRVRNQINLIIMSQITLEALGKEKGLYLSHALDKVWLQNGVQGLGEVFVLEQRGDRVALACTGGEQGKYLSHAFEKLWLQDGIQGEGEEWIMVDHGNGNVSFNCLGKETGLTLSHAFGKMWLQNGYQGEGELWAMRNY